ncbi:ProQ/FINO family protein [Halomonas sp. SpR1]|uniref:ProQ/FINO family protein n=1 Tax=Halomonas sp. SpR1 TaxID=3050462 RepID=UPI0027E3BA48|nr:ProQ/FINO family protein [Halomonas sp. SpR1]MDQ7733418.1 ProQ/FINO family protein [Halomonas sp. SpR1]
MAASLINMLDDLEARLERTQAELQALREENQRLKQQLAQKDAQEQSVPSSEPTTVVEADTPSEAAFDKKALDTKTLDAKAPEKSASAEVAPVKTDPAAIATEEKAESSATNEAVKTPSPHALLNQWYERYPKAFFKGHTKPLKVGIHQELAEREEWPNKLIRRALANYVNLPRYIKAVREGAERVDLDGQPAGKVDKEAALHASQKRGDQKVAGQPKKVQSNSSPAAKKPRVGGPKPPEVEPKVEKAEPRKPLSMEDKLLDLQQKFKGR